MRVRVGIHFVGFRLKQVLRSQICVLLRSHAYSADVGLLIRPVVVAHSLLLVRSDHLSSLLKVGGSVSSISLALLD